MHNEKSQEVYGTLMVFLKRFPFGQMVHFGLKMACCHNTGSTLRIYFEILKRYMKISLMFFFSEKNSFWANGSFWIQKWFDFITLNSLSDFFLFSKIKGTKRYMKLKLMVFQKKYLVGVPENAVSFYIFAKWKRWRGKWKWNNGLETIFIKN